MDRQRYIDNVKKVIGPMTTHTIYGEIFLLLPGEVPYTKLFIFDINKFWFVNGRVVKSFIHNLNGYWYYI